MRFLKPVPGPIHVLHVAARVRDSRRSLRRAGVCVSASLVLACSGVADLDLGQDSNALQSSADEPTPPSVEPSGAVDESPEPVSTAASPSAALSPGQSYLVDPATGEVYVPCEASGDVAPESGPPVVEPDTGTPVNEPVPVSGGEPVEHAGEAWVQPVTPTEKGGVSVQPCVLIPDVVPVVEPSPVEPLPPGGDVAPTVPDEPPAVSPDSPSPPSADVEPGTPVPVDVD